MRKPFQQQEIENQVENLTDIRISREVLDIIGFGPKFAYPLTNNEFEIMVPTMIKDTEYVLLKSDMEYTEQKRIRAKLITAINNQKHYNKKNKNKIVPINKKLQKTKQFLKQHQEVIVTNSDKDKTSVILTTRMYKNGTQDILEDTYIYKKLNNDPTLKTQRLTNNLISQLYTQGHIKEYTTKKLKKYNSIPAKIYALPKTHKKGPLKFCPIVSTIGSPSYNISKYIHEI